MTWAIETGRFDSDMFIDAMKKDIEEINSVSFV
jgi:hypothetical protein